ncbi:MAG: hypothetical protein P8Y03_21710 [Anaerolineales bacterium]
MPQEDLSARARPIQLTAAQIYVHSPQGEHPIAEMPLQKKSVLQYRQVGFTQSASLQVNLVGWWGSTYENPI